MPKGKYTPMKGLLKNVFVFLVPATLAFCFLIFSKGHFHSPLSGQLTPWIAVGGCGASAGGASGDAQVKWIGNGVLGALIDCELIVGHGVLSKTSTKAMNKDSTWDSEYDGKLRMQTTMALLSLNYHPPQIMDIKISMPFLFKEGINIKNKKIVNTAPFGDLLLDLNRKWGTSGNISSALSVIFPTGNSSIMESGIVPLSSDNQLGGGLFSASLRGIYTFDFDWGIISVGGSYSGGLFAIRTTEYKYDTAEIRNGTFYEAKLSSEKTAFEFAREGFGARNDAGVLSPDFVAVFSDIGIKTEGFTHGFSINCGIPLAQSFMEGREVVKTNRVFVLSTKEQAQQFLDTTHYSIHCGGDTANIVLNQNGNGTWNYLSKLPTPRKTLPSMTLQYSVEKCDMMFPILLGGVIKLEYDNKFVFSGFSVGLGFKFPVY
jgi:hypothetical protein